MIAPITTIKTADNIKLDADVVNPNTEKPITLNMNNAPQKLLPMCIADGITIDFVT